MLSFLSVFQVISWVNPSAFLEDLSSDITCVYMIIYIYTCIHCRLLSACEGEHSEKCFRFLFLRKTKSPSNVRPYWDLGQHPKILPSALPFWRLCCEDLKSLYLLPNLDGSWILSCFEEIWKNFFNFNISRQRQTF